MSGAASESGLRYTLEHNGLLREYCYLNTKYRCYGYLQIPTNRSTQWWVLLPACPGNQEWVAGSHLDFAAAKVSQAHSADKAARVLMTIASMAVAKKTENGIETRTDGGTEIGKDLENIAKGKIVKGKETFNLLIGSRYSKKRRDGNRYRFWEHRDS